MINKNNKDNKKRKLVFKYEIQRIFYKSIIRDHTIPPILKYQAILRLGNIPKNSSKVRVNNRCVFTGRGKSVYRFCRFSRIIFRELASNGFLIGITKSSW